MDAEALYAALVSDPARLRTLSRLQYRCVDARCLLLDALALPDTVFLHQKRYQVLGPPERSPER